MASRTLVGDASLGGGGAASYQTKIKLRTYLVMSDVFHVFIATLDTIEIATLFVPVTFNAFRRLESGYRYSRMNMNEVTIPSDPATDLRFFAGSKAKQCMRFP
jgi:hypothetical protein